MGVPPGVVDHGQRLDRVDQEPNRATSSSQHGGELGVLGEAAGDGDACGRCVGRFMGRLVGRGWFVAARERIRRRPVTAGGRGVGHRRLVPRARVVRPCPPQPR